MIFGNISTTIGKTPLIKLNRVGIDLDCNIMVKTESRNPAGSVKCRVAYSMLEDAIKTGTLKEGMTIVEPTSGNTGVALASMGRAKGFDVTIVMPESMSIERRKLIQGFGAELILTPAAEGMQGSIKKAKELVEKGAYFMPDQFSNPANPAIHALTTAPEIDSDTEGVLDAVVAGVGTGGTISGIGYYFKSLNKKDVTLVAVEPSASPVITQTLLKREIKPAAHKIQGIGAGFIPKNLNLEFIDKVITVDNEEAFEYASRLMKEEGILCGISGGAALCGAIKFIKSAGWKDKNVVVIIPDSGERYISTILYE